MQLDYWCQHCKWLYWCWSSSFKLLLLVVVCCQVLSCFWLIMYFVLWIQVVLLPVLAGAFLNQYFQGLVEVVSPLMPPIAVATVAVLCGNAIAQSSSAILVSGQQVFLATSLLHASGFFFGYIFSRMLGIDVASSRTISIEVGMQVSSFHFISFFFFPSELIWPSIFICL